MLVAAARHSGGRKKPSDLFRFRPGCNPLISRVNLSNAHMHITDVLAAKVVYADSRNNLTTYRKS